MKTIKKKEKGFALVLSLILLLVMSLMGGALIVISSGDHNSNNSSDQFGQTGGNRNNGNPNKHFTNA